jgi:hypothetical protein
VSFVGIFNLFHFINKFEMEVSVVETKTDSEPALEKLAVEENADCQISTGETEKLQKNNKPDFTGEEYNYLRNSGFSSEIFKIEGKFKHFLSSESL